MFTLEFGSPGEPGEHFFVLHSEGELFFRCFALSVLLLVFLSLYSLHQEKGKRT